MVRVLSCHHFTSQEVFSTKQEPEVIFGCGDKLFIATVQNVVEVYQVDAKECRHLLGFLTVSAIDQLVYSECGKYVATVEVKSSKQRSLTFVRLYFNWEGSDVTQPVRARIAGVPAGNSQPENTGKQLEVVELPLRKSATCIQCCAVTGNLAIGIGSVMSLYRLCSKTVQLTGTTYTDLDHLLDIHIGFNLAEIALCENYVGGISADEVRVLQVHFKNETDEDATNPKELVGEDVIRSATPTDQAAVQDDVIVEDEDFILWSFEEHNLPVDSVHSEIPSGASPLPRRSVSPRLQTNTISLRTISSERPYVEKSSKPTEVLGPVDSVQGRPITVEWAGLYSVGISIKGMNAQLSTTTLLYRRFAPGDTAYTAVDGALHSLQFLPTYSKSDKSDKSRRSRVSVLPAEGRCSPLHPNPQEGTLHGLCCFFTGPRQGFLYDIYDGANLLASYPYTADTSKVVAGDSLLHAVTRNGLETYTLRKFAAAVHRMEDIDNIHNTCPHPNMDICLIGMRPFIAIQAGSRFQTGTQPGSLQKQKDISVCTSHVLLLSKVESPKTQRVAGQSHWSLYALQNASVALRIEELVRCPDSCRSYMTRRFSWSAPGRVACRCPDKDWAGSPCSWVGHGGNYSFPVCLDAIPTDFDKATGSIFIQHVRSSVIPKRSFPIPNSLRLLNLYIQKTNVSTVRPGAFQGLPSLHTLVLADNRISSLEPDTFLGLKKVKDLSLEKNAISVISQHAFRGLPHLAWLRLRMNRLRSVPVDALLPPAALKVADLSKNHITTIDSQVLLLSQQQRLHLRIASNELTCDGNLTWFICNLPDLDQISAPTVLRCASPADLRGTLLATMRKDVCQTVTDGPRQGMTGRGDGTSVTTGPRINTSLYDNSIPTEMPNTSNVPGSEYTTGIDIVVLLDTPIITEDDDSRRVNAIIITAVVVFFLLVLGSVGVIRCRGTGLALHNGHAETDGSDKIEPYAMTTINDNPMYSATYGDNQGPQLQPNADEGDKTEPYVMTAINDNPMYSVTYGDNQGPQLQPNAVTHDEDPGPQLQSCSVTYEDPGPQLQACSVTYEDPGPQLQACSVTYEDPGPQLQPCSVTYEYPGPQLQPCSVTYEDPGPQLQPNAVTHDEDQGPQLQPYAVTHDEDPGPQLQPYAVTHDEDPGPQLQPYAVTHDEDPGPQLQPYAVTHDEDPEPQLQPCSVTYEDPGPQLQPNAVTHDEDQGPQLQPYAVTHDEDPGPQLQPYAVTHDEDPGPQLQPYAVTHDEDPGPQLQPYAVTHDEDPEPQLQPYSVTYEDPGPQHQPNAVTDDEDQGPQLQPNAVTQDEDPGPQIQPNAVTHDEDPEPQLQPYSVTYEDPGPQHQPNAVTHDEDPGPQLQTTAQPNAVTHDEDPGPQLQTNPVTHDEDPGPQLQPYSVTHDEDQGPQLQPNPVIHDEDPEPQLQPYSVTHDEDQGPQLQPNPVTHDEDPGLQLQPNAPRVEAQDPRIGHPLHKVSILHAVHGQLYKDMLDLGLRYQNSSPPAFHQLLCEGHLLLRQALFSQEAGSRTQQLRDLLCESCGLLGDYHSLPDSQDWSLALPYYNMSGLKVAAIVQQALHQMQPDRAQPGYGRGLVHFLDHVLFTPDEPLETDKSTSNIVLEAYSQLEPESLSKVIIKSRLRLFDDQKAVSMLRKIKRGVSGSGARYQPRPLDVLAMAVLKLRLCEPEQAQIVLSTVKEPQLVQVLVSEHQLLRAESTQLSHLSQLLRRHQPQALIAALVALQGQDVIPLETALQLLRGSEGEIHQNTHVRDYLEGVVQARHGQPASQTVAVMLCDIYIQRLLEWKPPTSRPMPAPGHVHVPRGGGCFGVRYPWLDHLPPFKGAGSIKQPCQWVQLRVSPPRGSPMQLPAAVAPIQTSKASPSVSEEVCTCCCCNEDLLKLQSLLCSGNIGTDIPRHVLQAITEDMKGFLAVKLLCLARTDPEKAVELMIDSHPSILVSFGETIFPESQERWTDVMHLLLRMFEDEDSLPDDRHESLTGALQGVLSRLASLMEPRAFINLLPSRGTVDFFLPYIQQCLRKHRAGEMRNRVASGQV
ncbi:HPS3 [Branchiostoma lanceolatum]|uniref:HPS3 protein n=1 Tax=Branchiostoma lanceolatum TaxID=7740 RepID=A0A8K0ET11_BRALA|nr:HPS3 [Branchiostoma lanceolatum]